MKPDKPVLHRRDYVVEPISMEMCVDLVSAYHYAKGGSNTGVHRHGLFHRDDFMTCLGVAWWLPPTPSAARYWWPENWQAVLALSRLVIHPDVPQNGASFLLSRSEKLIRRDPRWECLITYADPMEGHTGAIYVAAGWEFEDWTTSKPRWVDPHGRMVAAKATKTRTHAEMLALGYQVAGRSQKLRFRKVLRPVQVRGGLDAAA